MTGEKVRLSILIPSSRAETPLERLLESLQKFDSSDIETIVILNPPRSSSLPSAYPWVKWTHSQAGSNRARRKGLELAQGEWLWYLDDDVVVPSDFDPEKLEDLLSNSVTDAYSGVYLAPKNLHPLAKSYFIVSDTWLKQCHYLGVPFLIGGNFLIRRSLMHPECWPETIVYGGAELPLNFEIFKSAKKITIEKELAVEHHIPNLSLKGLREKARRQAKGSFFLQNTALKRLLTQPAQVELYRHHDLYQTAPPSEREQIEAGIHAYLSEFKNSRKAFSSPVFSWVHRRILAQNLYRAYRLGHRQSEKHL